jgi:hypothetical protein
MNADGFEDAIRVSKGSRLARAGESALGMLRSAAGSSFVVAGLRHARARVTELAPSERVRLGGVVIVTATITQGLLLQWAPSIARPAAPALLRFEIAAAGVLMIVAARPIARAWTGSRMRRVLRRGRSWLSQPGTP